MESRHEAREHSANDQVAPRAVETVALALAKDGRAVLATAGEDPTVTLWDVPDGSTPAKALRGHNARVFMVTWVERAAGRLNLISCDSQGQVRVWEPLSGKDQGKKLGEHEGPVYAVAAVNSAKDRLLVASGGQDGIVRLWDGDSGTLLWSPSGHEGWISSVCFGVRTDKKPILASAGADQMIRIWDLQGKKLTRTLPGHSAWVSATAMTTARDGTPLLVTGDRNGEVRWWDPDSGELLSRNAAAHSGVVYSFSFGNVDERPILASGGGDGVLRLWDVEGMRPLGAPILGHSGIVYSVSTGVDPEGNPLLASGGEDGWAQLWDLRDLIREARNEVFTLDTMAVQDKLARGSLARHLNSVMAEFARDEKGNSRSGAVIAIDGPWGSGKTTLANMAIDVSRGSASEPNGIELKSPIIVPFDAWRQAHVGPHWWTLASAVYRAVRSQRSVAAAAAMIVSGGLRRVWRSPATLMAGGLAVLTLVLWFSVPDTARSSWTTESLSLTVAVVAMLMVLSRFLFWASPVFGRAHLRTDDNPLEDVAQIIADLRRWSPRLRPRHPAEEVMLALALVPLCASIILAAGQWPIGEVAAGLGSLITRWPNQLIAIAGLIALIGYSRLVWGSVYRRWLLFRPSIRAGRASLGGTVLLANAAFAALWLHELGGASSHLSWLSWPGWLVSMSILLVLAACVCLLGWLKAADDSARRPIVVLIDDLDRCLADVVAGYLSTVHTLLHPPPSRYAESRYIDAAPMIVLVAADLRWLRKAFDAVYETFAEPGAGTGVGADFLQKVFDHTVLVPSLTSNQVDRFMEDVLGVGQTPETVDASLKGRIASFSSPGTENATASAAAEDVELATTEKVGVELAALEEVDVEWATTADVGDEVTPPSAAQTTRGLRSTDAMAAHLLTNYAHIMPTNPRTLRRVVNAWGMLLALQEAVLSSMSEADIVRAAVLLVRYPQLASEVGKLASEHGAAAHPAAPWQSGTGEQESKDLWTRKDVVHVVTRGDGSRMTFADLASCYGQSVVN